MSDHIIHFFIPGDPRPAGSKTAYPIFRNDAASGTKKWTGRFNVVDASGKSGKEWRRKVRQYARLNYKGAILDDPFLSFFTFYLKRPKSHYFTGKKEHVLKPDAPQFPTKTIDVIKLGRSVEDALTGIIWKDDSSNIVVIPAKVYAASRSDPGCSVVIYMVTSREEIYPFITMINPYTTHPEETVLDTCY